MENVKNSFNYHLPVESFVQGLKHSKNISYESASH